MTTECTKPSDAHPASAAERLLVCIGTGSSAADLVRATARLAEGLRASWVAVHVETAGEAMLPEPDRQRLAETLNLADELGGEAVTLTGQDVADELVAYCRARRVSKIILGKSRRAYWQEWLRPSLVSRLTQNGEGVDVYALAARSETGQAGRRWTTPIGRKFSPAAYLSAIAVVAFATGLGFLMFPYFAVANIIMVYLLGVVATSLWFGRGPSVLASVLSVAAFDFFFIPPFLTFTVDDKQYFVVFAVMLVTGLVISTLTGYLRFQVESARSRERRTAALYASSQELVHVTSIAAVIEVAALHIGDVFDADVFIVLPEDIPLDLRPVQEPDADTPQAVPPSHDLSAAEWQLAISESQLPATRLQIASTTGKPLGAREREAAQWVFEHGECAGFSTDTLPSSRILFVPMPVREQRVGVLGLQPRNQTLLAPDQIRLLQAFAGQIALAIARIQSSSEAQRARLQGEYDRLRGSFLGAVSHELRTPLANIVSDSTTLVENGRSLPAEKRQELSESIFDESERLNRLVANLLDMTRLQTGAIQVQREWTSLDELIRDVVHALAWQLGSRSVVNHLPADLSLVFIDEALMRQVLTNLLEYAHRRAPVETPLEISASMGGERLEIEVAHRGPGFAPGEERWIFDMFHHPTQAGRRDGVGLALSICRSIVELHGGWILAENRVGGGAVFHISLPHPSEQPSATKAN